MDRYFTKTFVKFFVGFVLIIGVAFGVLALSSTLSAPAPIDNLAVPR